MVFRTHRRVEFRDTDAAGIVHFSAFFPMMEAAEHEMLRSLGISVMPRPEEHSGQPVVTWPRVAASCHYKAAARFEDELDISVAVSRLGDSSVSYQIEFHRDGQLLAVGQVTAVCCQWNPGHSQGGLQKVTIPDAIRAKLTGLLVATDDQG